MATTKSPPNQVIENNTDTNQKRIHDIDALRGVTLLGILLVHTAELWGFDQDQPLYDFSQFGPLLKYIIMVLLVNRCAPIFGMLFGVSFYLILKNPTYSGWKFAWRCLLLVSIGILNKIFYTTDILMWYGIWGIVLLSIRNCTPRTILSISILTHIASIILPQFSLGDMLFQSQPAQRYVENFTLRDVLSYPLFDAIRAYLRLMLNGGIFTAFSYMAFGYWMAKKELMNNIKNWATPQMLFVLLVLYIGLYAIGEVIPVLREISFAFGAAFMATLFLYIYRMFPRGMKLLEAYGRMGLTNYSFQGIIGTCSLVVFLFPHQFDFTYILIYYILVYFFQCLFSTYWLKYFKYGPMEYLWRCFVSFRFTSPLKNN